MGTADQLLEKIFSWIEENERCEKQLRKLARELESLREKCNAGQCVGNSVAVVGGICTIAGGVATLMTAGAAAPLLGLGALYSGVGGAISLSSDVIEIILSSEPMKEAQKAAKKSAKIENEIQQLFKKLKMERNRMNSSADLDELDRHVVIEIIKAIARRKGLTVPITITHHTFKYMYNKREDKNFQMICAATLGILAVFAFKLGGTGLRSLYARGAEQINRLMSTAAYKRGAAVVQAVGIVFTLREAIDNWTDMIKKNHVTEASKSLRDKADEIKEVTQALREQLDDIKRKLEEMDRRR
ncbi:uncharacterized protein [Trachinotus anak]|uniref:uncharacterized protein isoform X2 n=1 Tax=Trachinotus anak TaxID=443729 RepID=UPI0039F17FA1